MLQTTALHKALLVSLVILLSNSQASTISAGINVWTSHEAEDGSIYALAIHPATSTIRYAGTSGGVSKSTNGDTADLAADIMLPVPSVARNTIAGDWDGANLYQGTDTSSILSNAATRPLSSSVMFTRITNGDIVNDGVVPQLAQDNSYPVGPPSYARS